MSILPKQGEIWLISFEPQVGKEITKIRPAVVLSSDRLGVDIVKTVVPCRDFHPKHEFLSYYFPIEPSSSNGLHKKSTIDCLQIKSFDRSRFQKRIGKLSQRDLFTILGIVNYCMQP